MIYIYSISIPMMSRNKNIQLIEQFVEENVNKLHRINPQTLQEPIEHDG